MNNSGETLKLAASFFATCLLMPCLPARTSEMYPWGAQSWRSSQAPLFHEEAQHLNG